MNLTIEDVFRLENPFLVDVRSPSEHSDDTIPGAVNLPVLSDEERAEVGKVYHREAQRQARARGAQYILKRIPAILDRLAEISSDRPIVIFCWRGGMRSKALHHILNEIGFRAYRIKGGYKAYRRHVLSSLNTFGSPDRLVTLYGWTGSGKTELLHALSTNGCPTVDLEGLANHRGSSFGSIGLGPQPSQKTFDSRLFASLREQEESGLLVLEGESRNIGQVTIPESLYNAMRAGRTIWLETSRETRIRRIVKEYALQASRRELLHALSRIEKQLGGGNAETCRRAIENGDEEQAVGLLLDAYYDPRYRHSSPDRNAYDLHVGGESIREAAATVAVWLERQSYKDRAAPATTHAC